MLDAAAQPRVLAARSRCSRTGQRIVFDGLRARLAGRPRPGPPPPSAGELRQAQRATRATAARRPHARSCSTSCWRWRSRAAAGSRGSTTSPSTAAAAPWVSGLAQGTALQAIARSAVELDRLRGAAAPRSPQGLEMFEQAPPTGVRVRDRRRARTTSQYSFWPVAADRSTASSQSLVGLYDVAQITGDPRAAAAVRRRRRAGARSRCRRYDTGAWSLYSRGAITRESDLSYHTLLRDFLANLCDRTADARLLRRRRRTSRPTSTQPPVLELRTPRAARRQAGTLRFDARRRSRA